MASSTLRHLVSIAFVLLLGVSFSLASPHPELGLAIHPAFSPPVYVLKNPETPQESSRVKKEAACELNITESGPDLHEVRKVTKKFFSFFVKPKASFKRLVFKLSLQNVFYVSGDFHSDEYITITSKDLAHSGGAQQWTHVKVEHYKVERRGFDRHGFRVSFGNRTRSQVTYDSWFIKGFKGFTVFAEGAAQVLFNCAPDSMEEPPMRGYVFYSIWVMAGLLIIAIFFLSFLCLVWVYLRQQKKKQASVSPIKYPVYEEFDEVVLEKIKQKVEALRSGKIANKPDTVVVNYSPRQENTYVLQESGYAELEEGDKADHQYEDIDKNYRQRCATDTTYQNVSNDAKHIYAVDNIYEVLPGYEECLKGRRAPAKTSAP